MPDRYGAMSDRELIISLAGKVDNLMDCVTRLERAYYGNGSSGVLARMAQMEERVRHHTQEESHGGATNRAEKGGIVAGFTAGLVAVLWRLAETFA